MNLDFVLCFYDIDKIEVCFINAKSDQLLHTSVYTRPGLNSSLKNIVK